LKQILKERVASLNVNVKRMFVIVSRDMASLGVTRADWGQATILAF